MKAPIAAALLVAACSEPAPPHWQVDDGFLRDPGGRAAIMRGVNLSGEQKNAPYLDDKQPADYARVRDAWGFNAIRFVMTWAAVEPAEGVYDDAYLDGVAERMGWAADAGLAVVLDMHEDIYGEGFGYDGAPRWSCSEDHYAAFVPQDPWFLNSADPNVQACVDEFFTIAERRDHFVAAWGHVAERLGKLDAIVGFDLLNEPNWGSYPSPQFEHDRLLPLYSDVVATVRAAAPTWVAFVEPSAARNLGFATKLIDLPFGDVMYSPHSYDAGAESGAGFDPAHRQAILDNVSALADEARTLGAGLWIGEYGGDPDQPGIVDYMTAQYDAAGQFAGSTMYWAYDKGGGYSLIAADGSERPVLANVLARPYPERVAGDPIAYAFEAATSTFRFSYVPGGGATSISVPARVYPAGYQVECGGCTFHQEAGALVIDKPPATLVANVVITPLPS